MSRNAKYLKMLLFIIVFIWGIKSSWGSEGIFSVFADSLLFASVVYIFATLFGLILDVTGNYIIAIVLFLILIVVGCTKLDALTQSVAWLTDGIWEFVLIIIGIALIVKDVLFLKKTTNVPPQADQ